MATVYIPTMLQTLSRGEQQVALAATSLRQVVDGLEALFPGMKAFLVEDEEIKPHIAVAVDGEVAVLGLMERVSEDSEVHFMPALGGGNGNQ